MKIRNLTYSEQELVFVGMGAANSLLFLELSRAGLLTGKNITVIEPSSKTQNDRTFCFWATELEIADYQLDQLISKTWNKASAGQRLQESIAPYKYHHISGIDLYNHTKIELQKYPIHYQRDAISDTELESRKDALIFDSRPPTFKPCEKSETQLIQSFLGWNINTKNEVFDTETFVMMDFTIEQNDVTLFLYILPFSSKNALVELTSFHTQTINIELAENLLKTEIQKRFGEFQIQSTEHGNIPMCTAKIDEFKPTNPFYFATGGRAGNIKPSTGYSFLKSCKHAREIANCIQNGQKPLVTSENRFNFYDRLLLKILETKPTLGKTIFESLFQSNKLSKVIEFLREESNGINEFKILSSLPIFPFVFAAIRDFFHRKLLKLIPVILACIFILLQNMNFGELNVGILALGLLTIGIPHGAVDHLLESNQLKGKITIGFIVRYLLKMAAMGLIWWINPYVGLLSFIVYSSWHFGEAEYKNMQLNGFIWGLSVIGCILFSHPKELTEILNEMSIHLNFINSQWALFVFSTTLLFVQLKRGIGSLWELLWLPLSMNLPLLHAFGIFFIFSHSMVSSVDLIKNYTEPASKLIKKAIPFTLGAVLFFGGFYYFDLWKTEGTTGLFFIFLSCISFPHVFAMHGFYHNFSGTSINKISA